MQSRGTQAMTTRTRPPQPASDNELADFPGLPPSPTLLDEACWAVCPHIQRWASPELKECLRCPALEREPEIGLSKRLCRINAEKAAIAALNVANRWAIGQTSQRTGRA
jgi:hypothetical protein